MNSYKDPYYAEKWLREAEAALKESGSQKLDELLRRGIDLPDKMVGEVENARELIAARLLQAGPSEPQLATILLRTPAHANEVAKKALSQKGGIDLLCQILYSKGIIEEDMKKEAVRRILERSDELGADQIIRLLSVTGLDDLKTGILKIIFSPEFKTEKLFDFYMDSEHFGVKAPELREKAKEGLIRRGLSLYLKYDESGSQGHFFPFRAIYRDEKGEEFEGRFRLSQDWVGEELNKMNLCLLKGSELLEGRKKIKFVAKS